MTSLNWPESDKRLVLLETADQTYWFVENQQNQANHTVVLAITPEVAYTCQKLAQPYLKLEDHAHVANRQLQFGSILQEYIEWEGWLNNWAQRTIHEFDIAQFEPVSAVTFLFQILFTEIWATVMNLREFIEAVQPDQVILWIPHIMGVPWYLHPTVSPLPALLPDIAREYGIEVVNLSVQTPALAPVSKNVEEPTGLERLIWWSKHQLFRNPIMTELAAMRDFDVLSYIKQFLPNTPNILFSGYGYDLTPLARELRQRSHRITILSDVLPPVRLRSQHLLLDEPLASKLRATGKQLLAQSEIWAPLKNWGIRYTPLWAKPLDFWWNYAVPELWFNYRYVKQLLKQRKFVALVTCDSGGNTLSGAAINAAANTKVPRYIYQHGSTCDVDARVWRTFLQNSDHFLIYGQGTVNELNHSCPSFIQSRTQLVPVGSGRLDLLRRRYKLKKAQQRLRAKLQVGDNRPLILYVPTLFGGYGRTVEYSVAYQDISYFELQQTILKLWAESPNVRLLYKEFSPVNSYSNPIPDFIQKHVPGAIVTNQSLVNLMWAVDAIIVDHVITAIGEVLLTKKPIVVYMPNSDSKAKTLLQKRATVAQSLPEFVDCVRTLLRKDSYPEIENPNTEFLQAYGTHLNDGCSAKRAADVILQGYDD